MLKRSNFLGACLCALIALVFLTAGCSKKDSPPVYTGPPTLTSLNAMTFHPGDTVRVSGKGLIAGTYIIGLFDSVNLNALQTTDTSVIFVLPAASHFGFYGAASGDLSIQSPNVDQQWTITIDVPEPHGWFAQYKMTYGLRPMFIPQLGIHIHFPSDSIGYFQDVYDGIFRSTDGGNNWHITSSNGFGYPNDLAVLDSNNLFSVGYTELIGTTNGGNSWTLEPLPSALTNTIGGASMLGPATGLIMNTFGSVYSLAGSWDTTSATGLVREYTSIYSNDVLDWNSISAVDIGDCLIGGAMALNYNSPVNADVVVKTNGIYDEYTLSTSLSSSALLSVQLLNPTLGFAMDQQGHLLKYTGNRNWSSLNQAATAFLFLDANNGYTSSGGSIYQTTNGGQSWSSVFNLQPNQVVYNFTTHNGHVWGIGNDTTAGKGFIIKYNP